MVTIQKIEELRQLLDSEKNLDKSLGFVPTMGALHLGHISLIEKARKNNDLVISSIFVNPTQFNDPQDLVNYPRTPEKDAQMLSQAGCDILFSPTVEEMYETDLTNEHFEFGELENTMEGSHRPGHFKGVATIVSKLFNIVKPTNAYFGEKDFQQLAIIRALSNQKNLNINIIGCEIIREADGLAMSSRNVRLTIEERAQAPLIFETLSEAQKLKSSYSVENLKNYVIEKINKNKLMSVDYFEIVDSKTLISISEWTETQVPRACIAVKTGQIRLLDNIALFS